MSAGWDDFRAEMHRALAEQVEGRSEPYKALWSQKDPVMVMGAEGGCDRGWEKASAGIDVASRMIQGGNRTIENLVTTVGDEVAVTVDFEHVILETPGLSLRKTLRCTHAYRVEDGEWRIFLRHADEYDPEGLRAGPPRGGPPGGGPPGGGPPGGGRREVRREGARQEEARQEEARQEEARQEEARQEEARQEEARQEEARQEARTAGTRPAGGPPGGGPPGGPPGRRAGQEGHREEVRPEVHREEAGQEGHRVEVRPRRSSGRVRRDEGGWRSSGRRPSRVAVLLEEALREEAGLARQVGRQLGKELWGRGSGRRRRSLVVHQQVRALLFGAGEHLHRPVADDPHDGALRLTQLAHPARAEDDLAGTWEAVRLP